MRKFKVKIDISKEFEMDIDESKITDEVIKNFEKNFYNLNEEDDKIKSLANDYCRLRAIGNTGNIEGYGYVLEDGELPLEALLQDISVENITNGINFKVIDDGESDPIIEVREI